MLTLETFRVIPSPPGRVQGVEAANAAKVPVGEQSGGMTNAAAGAVPNARVPAVAKVAPARIP